MGTILDGGHCRAGYIILNASVIQKTIVTFVLCQNQYNFDTFCFFIINRNKNKIVHTKHDTTGFGLAHQLYKFNIAKIARIIVNGSFFQLDI